MRPLIMLFVLSASLFAQADSTGSVDSVSTSVGRHKAQDEQVVGPYHPYTLIAKHPKVGCINTADCGDQFYEYHGKNLRTSAGTTWQSQLMGSVSTPTVNTQCNYIALTNTAVTPAEADTTLSGEIAVNGLSRAQSAYTDASTTLTIPSAPTTAVTGGTGTAVFYFVAACNQGICTTPSVASGSTSVNATLNSTNYVTVSFTGQSGAASYVIIRSNSSSAPSGSLAGGSLLTSTGQINGVASCTSANACTAIDTSNTVTAYTVPGSNVTNFGKYTLVKTFTASGAQSAQAFGIFTAVSTGTMCFEGTFTQVSLNINDTFQLTETVFF